MGSVKGGTLVCVILQSLLINIYYIFLRKVKRLAMDMKTVHQKFKVPSIKVKERPQNN